MNVGFTGTKNGMTLEQINKFIDVFGTILLGSREKQHEFHHGDCVGADKEAHAVAAFRSGGINIIIHPPSDARYRAWCAGDSILPPRPYLMRNHDIVDSSEVIIACPATHIEVLRSGTWATIRYAKKCRKKICIIFPNGVVRIVYSR